MEQTQPGKVFDLTNEDDRKAYQEQIEKDNLRIQLYPPRDRRSIKVRKFLERRKGEL